MTSKNNRDEFQTTFRSLSVQRESCLHDTVPGDPETVLEQKAATLVSMLQSLQADALETELPPHLKQLWKEGTQASLPGGGRHRTRDQKELRKSHLARMAALSNELAAATAAQNQDRATEINESLQAEREAGCCSMRRWRVAVRRRICYGLRRRGHASSHADEVKSEELLCSKNEDARVRVHCSLGCWNRGSRCTGTVVSSLTRCYFNPCARHGGGSAAFASVRRRSGVRRSDYIMCTHFLPLDRVASNFLFLLLDGTRLLCRRVGTPFLGVDKALRNEGLIGDQTSATKGCCSRSASASVLAARCC